MQKTLAFALVASVLVAVPAGFAAVSVGPQLLAPHAAPLAAKSAASEPAQKWAGDVPAGVTHGSIDFRTVTGTIHILPSPAAESWDVAVIVPPKNANAVSLGENQYDYDFHGDVVDGALQLTLTVTQKSEALLNVDQPDDLAIVAQVPARIAWDTVHACSGASWSGPVALFGDDSGDSGCVRQDAAGLSGGITIVTDDSGVDEPFLVEGLHGAKLELAANNEGLGAKAIEFDETSIVSNNGGIRFTGTGGSIQLVSNNGDIDAVVKNVADAKLGVVTNNGQVHVQVPVGKDRAFDVGATTNNGQIEIRLPDMKDAGSDGGQDTQGPLPLGLLGKPPSDEGSSQSAHKVSSNYEAADIHTVIKAVTNNGDILVEPLAEKQA
jgi:hypothetical protein